MGLGMLLKFKGQGQGGCGELNSMLFSFHFVCIDHLGSETTGATLEDV